MQHVWVLVAFYLLGGAALSYWVIIPLIERAARYYRDRVQLQDKAQANRRILAAFNKLNPPPQPDLYRDPQVDGLLAQGRLDEAWAMVQERQRQAHERGRDDRVAFYTEYEAVITEARRQPTRR